MKHVKHLIRNEQGAAMVVALAILLMLGLIGVAAVQTSKTDMDVSQSYQHHMKSFYVAQAGAELGYATLRDSSTWRTGFQHSSFSGGQFDVTVTDISVHPTMRDTLAILSTGHRSEAVSEVEIKVVSATPFQWALFGHEEAEVEDSSRVDSYNADSGSYAATKVNGGGHVGSNGELEVENNATVYGNALTAGTLEIKNAAIVTGDTSSTAPTVILDSIPPADFSAALANNSAPTGLSGAFTYNSGTHNLTVNAGQTMTMASGTYYFNTVTVGGTINLAPGARVVIYVVGQVNVTDGARVNATGSPKNMLILGRSGEMEIKGNAIMAAAIYAPGAEVELEGNVTFYGAVVGREAEAEGDSDEFGPPHQGTYLHYDRGLKNFSLPNSMRRLGWREVI